MTDRQLGYVIMALTMLLAMGVAYAFWQANYSYPETRTLRFPDVGSLAIEDPVRMEGTLVGEVSGFEHDSEGRVLVHVRSKEPIPIRASSYVAVKVKGVMGERFIEITTGNPNDPLIGKFDIVDGKFEMGPSEAIIYMNLLEDKITELRDVMLWLRDGKDDGKRSFIVAFNDIVGTIDTLVYDLMTGLADMEDGLNAGLDTAAQIAQMAIGLTADIGAKAPKLIEDLSSMMEKIDDLATKVDTLIERVEPIVAKIDGNKYLWGDHLDKLRKQLAVMREYMDDLRDEGMPLTIKLRFF